MRSRLHSLLVASLLLGAAETLAAPATELGGWKHAAGTEDTATLTAEVRVDGFRDPAILLGGLVEPFEVSVDGQLVRPRGRALGPHGGWRWTLIPLPVGTGSRVVTVTVDADAPNYLGAPKTAFIGEHGQVVVAAVGQQLHLLATAVIAAVAGLFGLLVYLRRREQRIYLSFALFAIATGVSFGARANLHAILWHDAPTVWEHLRLAARTVAPAALVTFFVFTAQKPSWRMVRFVQGAVFVGLSLIILDVLFRGALHLAAVVWVNVEFLACVATTFVLITRRLREDSRRYALSAGALLLVLGAALLEAMRSPAASAAVVFAQLLLLATMGDLLLRRFAAVFAALQEEVRARDEFLSVVAHELRNPLAAVKAGVDLLSVQVVRPDHQKHLEMVTRQIKLLARLMDDLVDLGRIRAGRLKVEPVPLLVFTAVSSALETMRHAAVTKDVKLEATLPQEPLAVEADPMRLEQMVTNLLRNAIQHTAAGGEISVTVDATPSAVRLRIRDTGRGMTAEMLANLFGPEGSAVPPLSRRDSEGMGVGLALVRKLARLHGGSLSGASAGLNQGSELTLELRRALPPAGARAAAPSTGPTAGPTAEPAAEPAAKPAASVELEMPSPPSDAGALLGQTATTADPPKSVARRILLIDDNANLRLSMRLLLEHSGFRVQEAGDGRAGLEQLLSGVYDAAVVDLRMPEVDGLEVARRLRAHPLGQRIRLVALTGFSQPEEHQQARDAGFDDVLVKPANPEQLARALR